MKHLPLFYYPSTWVWVDDDKTLLSTMEMTFKRYNTIKALSDPKDCLNFLTAYHAPSADFSFLQHNIHDEDYDVMHRTPLNFDIASILSICDDPNRYNEVSAMVIDYNMPQMNGFELATQIKYLAIPKILLTGNREECNAIEGFNEGLIDRFVQKSEPDMVHKLGDYLKTLTYTYFQHLTSPLLLYLQAEQKISLSDPTFIDFFETYCDEHEIKEFYLIDKNGSYLCIDAQGKRHYLIVHTQKSIEHWLELNVDYPATLTDEIENIRQHRKIPFFGLGKEAWQVDPTQWSNYFYPAEVLEGREKYFWVEVK